MYKSKTIIELAHLHAKYQKEIHFNLKVAELTEKFKHETTMSETEDLLILFNKEYADLFTKYEYPKFVK